MNDRKVCFISCVNNQELYREALYYINQLLIPEGFEIECISVENAKSIANGYNEGMKASDAKYKVYLHQDVYLINKSLISDMLDVFEKNEQIGLIGVSGAKTIPANGIWWESSHKYGKVYESHTGYMKPLIFNAVQGQYESVEAVDGLIMITRYDLPWREDIFDGWHFYDVSQSMEFLKSGYEVAVASQEEPWCIHDCGILDMKNGYEYYRDIFLNEYSKDIFPLVSILIPTYNRPDYFKLALESALNQTYRNIEIIIGDDSTDDRTEKLVKDNYIGKYPNIIYYHNEKNMGQFDNDLKLLDMAKGEYINFLMDDDLFELSKLEKMMNYYIEDLNEEINLVTSHRGIIDEVGNYKGVFTDTDKQIEKTAIFDGIELGNVLIMGHHNFIGEPTTVVFRKSKLSESFGVFNGRKYGPNIDQASWLNLLSKGKGVFINEVLSYFRLHKGQQQNDIRLIVEGYIDHAHKLLTCRDKGFMLDDEDYLSAINLLIKNFKHFMKYNPDKSKFLSDTYKYNEFLEYFEKLNEKKKQMYRSTLSHNADEKLPLVSILIPAYNQTKYLKEALESALNQTYPEIEIIIGDDSTTDEVAEFLKPYMEEHGNITYFKNIRNEIDYGYKNHVECLKRSKGEYINFLNHDDVFHPKKIEIMMAYFIKNPNLTLVTSSRQPIDENGKKLPLEGAFRKIFPEDTVVGGYELSRMVLNDLKNYIGEPTTVLFKKRYINENELNYFNGERLKNIGDVANWFTLLQYGNAVYISEALSCFRIHSEQNSGNPEVHVLGIIAWYQLIKKCYEAKIVQSISEYKKLLSKWLTTFLPMANAFIEQNDIVKDELKHDLTLAYKEAIDELINKKAELNYECVICRKKIESFLPYQYKKHTSDYTNKFMIIGSDTENFSCPSCYCHDRARHLVLYFNKKDLWRDYVQNKKVLHIAPEAHIRKIISSIDTLEYICGDLYPSDDSIKKIDVTCISYADNYFDFIMCNHVLEHIPEDEKAMKELYRVLKKGGAAVLQTPYSPIMENSFEDIQSNSDADRLKYFGQADHVRVYGLDLFKKLEKVGFQLNIIRNEEILTMEECKKYGVNHREDLIMVRK